jgi:endonuclease/exonuclease/phosphatase family metal-dependent hydrolase
MTDHGCRCVGVIALAAAAIGLLGTPIAGCARRSGAARLPQSPAEARSLLPRAAGTSFRVLSWNVGGQGFHTHVEGFRTVFRLADPDILLLDEIEGGRTAGDVRSSVSGLRGAADTEWSIVIGEGGGYQRGAIISRHPVKPVLEFQLIPFPENELRELQSQMDVATWERMKPNLDAGLAVAAGVIQLGSRLVLGVAFDLQCCAALWQEQRRLMEIRHIYRAIQATLARQSVHAILLAGDFNTVSSAVPLAVITNPYPPPHIALVPVQARHLDGLENWTWDGRGSEFPSGILDFSLYSPTVLEVAGAWVLSTEDLEARELAPLGLTAETSRTLSDHLPIIVDYRWRETGMTSGRN